MVIFLSGKWFNKNSQVPRGQGCRGKTKMVTVIKNWKMVESSVEEGPNVPENAGKMVRPRYWLTLRCLLFAALS